MIKKLEYVMVQVGVRCREVEERNIEGLLEGNLLLGLLLTPN